MGSRRQRINNHFADAFNSLQLFSSCSMLTIFLLARACSNSTRLKAASALHSSQTSFASTSKQMLSTSKSALIEDNLNAALGRSNLKSSLIDILVSAGKCFAFRVSIKLRFAIAVMD